MPRLFLAQIFETETETFFSKPDFVKRILALFKIWHHIQALAENFHPYGYLQVVTWICQNYMYFSPFAKKKEAKV